MADWQLLVALKCPHYKLRIVTQDILQGSHEKADNIVTEKSWHMNYDESLMTGQ